MSDMGLWGVSAGDQITAAAAEGNLELCGQIGVEGFCRAFSEENGDTVPYDYAYKSLSGMEPSNLLVIAAAALKRIYDDERRDRGGS